MSRTSNRLVSLTISGVVVLVAAVMLVAAPVSAHPGPWYWSERDVVKRIVRTVIRVEDKRVRIAAPVTCLGEGRRIVRRGTDRWKHFSCIQSILFPRGGGLAGADVLFRVHVVGARRFRITNARFAD